jgi:N-acetylglucosamine-6-sulfatase
MGGRVLWQYGPRCARRLYARLYAATVAVTAVHMKRAKLLMAMALALALPAAAPPPRQPNIALFITDDQDQLIGGWHTPMRRLQASVAARGATALEWRISTPICAPSRAELWSGRYLHSIASEETTPSPGASNGGVGHVALRAKVWPHAFPIALKRAGYTTGIFGKCMNPGREGRQYGCEALHSADPPAFDRWFEGTRYVGETFFDSEAPGCGGYPYGNLSACLTKVSNTSVGLGYSTAEISNRTIAWWERLEAEQDDTPWFLYWAPHAPHTPATPPPWYPLDAIDRCNPDGGGTRSPRNPAYNYSGSSPSFRGTECARSPPGGHSAAGSHGGRAVAPFRRFCGAF